IEIIILDAIRWDIPTAAHMEKMKRCSAVQKRHGSRYSNLPVVDDSHCVFNCAVSRALNRTFLISPQTAFETWPQLTHRHLVAACAASMLSTYFSPERCQALDRTSPYF